MAGFDIRNLDVPAEDYKQGLMNLNNYSKAPTEGVGFGGFGQMFAPMAQAFQSLTMLNDGVKMALDGAKFQAGVFRSSGKAAMQGATFEASVLRQAGNSAVQIAKYNSALDQEQTNRQQDALSRQIGDVLSTNYAVAGNTGASIYSKSTMMIQQEVSSNAETMYNRNTNDAKQRQALIEFQGAMTNVQYENQARGAEYSGKVAMQNAENSARSAEYQGKIDAYKAKSQMASTIGDSVGGLFKSFGGL